MAEIVVEHVRHSYDGDLSDPAGMALKGIDLTFRDGGAYALLGPSGCGKSSMLNIMSGLVRPTAGRILFDGRDVTAVPTEARNIAQVFQFPVLYDTMSVYENLSFPLRNRRVAAPVIDRRVKEVAEMLDLAALLGRRARGLGAADKQKVSLGRGLVREDVAAVLFDEPLTVIDPHVKFELRRKLKEVHDTLKLTLVYVTHDQNEALTFADDVVVMSDGEVLQVGEPEDLYERPRHTFVGHFIGSPGINLIPATHGDRAIRFAGGALPLPDALASRLPDGARLTLGIRPQALRLARDGESAVAGAVIDVEPRGSHKIASVDLGGLAVKLRLRDLDGVPSGPVGLFFPPGQTLVYANDHLVGSLDGQD